MPDQYPRLCVEEADPPATLPFPRDTQRTEDEPTTDSIAIAQDALARAQRALDDLDTLVDETVIPFPGRAGKGIAAQPAPPQAQQALG